MFVGFVRQARSLLLTTKFLAGRNKGKQSLYDVLGVSRDADQSAIKRAYYKLAQQYHPDKNHAPDAKEKFAEISNAYQVLSDESKKRMYDQTGSTQSPFPEGMNYEDIFSQFTGGFQGGFPGGFQGSSQGNFDPSIFEDFAGMFMNGAKHHRTPPADIVVNVDVDFKDSVFGAEKDIKYFHRVVCTTCHGSKAKPGSKPKKCNSCHGKGQIDYRQGGFMFKMACGTCEGEGTVIKDICTRCKGQGIEQKQSIHRVTIPKGVTNGATIRVAGKGSCNEDKLCGDLIIKMTVKANPKFRRDGFDVTSTVSIPLADAVLGTEVKVDTIYGETRTVTVPEGSQSGDKIKLAGQGFQKGNTKDKGSHFVVIAIEIPRKLTARQRQLFQELRSTQSNA